MAREDGKIVQGPSGLLNLKPGTRDLRIEQSLASWRPFSFWRNFSDEDHVSELALRTKGVLSGCGCGSCFWFSQCGCLDVGSLGELALNLGEQLLLSSTP